MSASSSIDTKGPRTCLQHVSPQSTATLSIHTVANRMITSHTEPARCEKVLTFFSSSKMAIWNSVSTLVCSA